MEKNTDSNGFRKLIQSVMNKRLVISSVVLITFLGLIVGIGVAISWQSKITEEWKELWEQWTEYKKEEHRDKFKSQKSEQLALNNLVKISKERIEVARKIVSLSIINRWKGLFEIKEEEKKKNKIEQYQDWLEGAKNYINGKNNISEADNEVKRLSL